MITQQENYAKKKRSTIIDRNERMTAIAGAVLFIIIIVELFITANLHALITEHIFIGVLLSGPLIVKMYSTGYRFFRYYTKSPDFVWKGPPNILLRLLAPFLVFMTILVFISGFGLAFVGPSNMGLFFKIHAASVALWLPLLAVHVYAYIRKVPGIIASDWTRKSNHRVPGRKRRLYINVVALIVGGIGAIFMIPVSASWNGYRIHHGLPSPLVLGIAAAVLAILVAIPIFRKTNTRL